MTWEVRQGHVLDVLGDMPSESVQCVVTSPPYWGLRDYGLEPQMWDGKQGCDHEWGKQGRGGQRWRTGAVGGLADDGRRKSLPVQLHPSAGTLCLRCNAWAGSLGLEPTPDLYLEHIVQVFREVRRVLRKDGTVWLNLGDSYANQGFRGDLANTGGFTGERIRAGKKGTMDSRPREIPAGLKPKDLCGIPWRVAFALQADGWWLRSDIIWSKPNPMPESVTDRPTRAHEYVFLLTKSARYFYDADAVRESMAPSSESRYAYAFGGAKNEHLKATDKPTAVVGVREPTDGRNLRSVWTIPTEPFPEAHFATFPKKLVEPCVKAGSRPGDTVLDPFCGSGTVGVVARGLGRRFVGVELSETYADMARRRISGTKRGLDEDGTPLWEQETMFS